LNVLDSRQKLYEDIWHFSFHPYKASLIR